MLAEPADDFDQVIRMISAQLAPHFQNDAIHFVLGDGVVNDGPQFVDLRRILEESHVIVAVPSVKQQPWNDWNDIVTDFFFQTILKGKYSGNSFRLRAEMSTHFLFQFCVHDLGLFSSNCDPHRVTLRKIF